MAPRGAGCESARRIHARVGIGGAGKSGHGAEHRSYEAIMDVDFGPGHTMGDHQSGRR